MAFYWSMAHQLKITVLDKIAEEVAYQQRKTT